MTLFDPNNTIKYMKQLLIASLSFVVGYAWNTLSMSVLKKYSDDNQSKAIRNNIIYAFTITIVAALILVRLH